MQSLRRRAWVSGGFASLAAVTTGILLLYIFLEHEALQRFDLALEERHTQTVAALIRHADEPARIAEILLDPAYDRPLSGRYWQIIAPGGAVYSSESLLGSTLHSGEHEGSGLVMHYEEGEDTERYRVAHQHITLEDGTRWGVAVAETLETLDADRTDTQRGLVLAFTLVGLVGLLGMIVQTSIMLRPMYRLREDVARRWEQSEVLDSKDYPEEVAPLVDDINYLLRRNLEIVRRSRQQAADLAHALKTPSAILRNEITLMPNAERIAGKALEALDRLDAQLARSLIRIRVSNTAESTAISTDVTATLNRFSRTFGKLAEKAGKRLTIYVDPGLSLRADPQDLEEVLGNVMDNAVKWSRTQITVRVRQRSGGIELLIEDDGPGIKKDERPAALVSGKRLDASVPGAGLGLAITVELLTAYGATIELGESRSLSGLSVRLFWPVGGKRSR